MTWILLGSRGSCIWQSHGVVSSYVRMLLLFLLLLAILVRGISVFDFFLRGFHVQSVDLGYLKRVAKSESEVNVVNIGKLELSLDLRGPKLCQYRP